MEGILYEEGSVWVFIIVTLIFGGAAAWMTGRACAFTWRPAFVVMLYIALLAAAVHIVHTTLFGATFLSLHYYLVTLVVLEIIGLLGFRRTRVKQMVGKYGWLFEPAGPFAWRRKAAGGAAA